MKTRPENGELNYKGLAQSQPGPQFMPVGRLAHTMYQNQLLGHSMDQDNLNSLNTDDIGLGRGIDHLAHLPQRKVLQSCQYSEPDVKFGAKNKAESLSLNGNLHGNQEMSNTEDNLDESKNQEDGNKLTSLTDKIDKLQQNLNQLKTSNSLTKSGNGQYPWVEGTYLSDLSKQKSLYDGLSAAHPVFQDQLAKMGQILDAVRQGVNQTIHKEPIILKTVDKSVEKSKSNIKATSIEHKTNNDECVLHVDVKDIDESKESEENSDNNAYSSEKSKELNHEIEEKTSEDSVDSDRDENNNIVESVTKFNNKISDDELEPEIQSSNDVRIQDNHMNDLLNSKPQQKGQRNVARLKKYRLLKKKKPYISHKRHNRLIKNIAVPPYDLNDPNLRRINSQNSQNAYRFHAGIMVTTGPSPQDILSKNDDINSLKIENQNDLLKDFIKTDQNEGKFK